MPRRSAASFGFPVSVQQRLRAPSGLKEDERQLFVDIVAATPADHFRGADVPLLLGYIRGVLAAREAAQHLAAEGKLTADDKLSPWLSVLAQADRATLAFARQLRLSPLGRAPTTPSRPTKPKPELSIYERMALEEPDDDGPDTA
jgi:hypothetical protein